MRATAGRGWAGWAFALLAAMSGAARAQAPPKAALDAFAAHSGLPRSWVVSAKPEIVVAIRDRDSLRPGGTPQKVRLHGEAGDEAMADRLSYRSMRSLVEINCETRRDRVVEMEVFPQHGLRGPGEKRPVPGGWVQPSDDAYMADVIRAVCRAPQPAPAPALPQDGPVLRPALKAQAPAVRQAAAAPARTPPAPSTAGPRLMTLTQVAAVAKNPPTGGAAPPSRGAWRAQIGALDSAADAQRALAEVGVLRPGLATAVEPVTVGGRMFYRAYISGFAAASEAQAFCADRRRRAAPCLVR